jgi:hypothetical protein
MPKYAISNGQVIVNIIKASSEEAAEAITGMQAYDITATGRPAIGWVWDQATGTWIDPTPPVEEVIPGDNE